MFVGALKSVRCSYSLYTLKHCDLHGVRVIDVNAYNDLINSLPPAFHNTSDIACILTHSFHVALFFFFLL